MPAPKQEPINPRLIHPDGSVTNIELKYLGLSEGDIHVWGPADNDFTMTEDDTFLVDPPYPTGSSVVLSVLEKTSEGKKERKAGFVKKLKKSKD